MSVSSLRNRTVDYAPCRYNGSRLWFRGPRRAVRSPYVACLGGCDVYGRYVAQPLSARLETMLQDTVINLGVENAGMDAYLYDPGAMCTVAQARIVVIQLCGSHNTSNRYYTVHPRRNDRFLKASNDLKALYPEMDFTEVHFTGHLLTRLRDICPDRFETVVHEVQGAWRARMMHLISQVKGKVVFLWFSPRPLAATRVPMWDEGDPFLNRDSVEPLISKAAHLVEAVPTHWTSGHDDCALSPLDMTRAGHLPGPDAHQEAAVALAKVLSPMMS